MKSNLCCSNGWWLAPACGRSVEESSGLGNMLLS